MYGGSMVNLPYENWPRLAATPSGPEGSQCPPTRLPRDWILQRSVSCRVVFPVPSVARAQPLCPPAVAC